jgi:CheY-like chemotaxis protein
MTNILVIDDEPEVTRMIDIVLSSETCRVLTAHDGLAGLRILRERPIDLVITDIIMPECDGFEVIMEINKMKHWPRVIVITGGSQHLSEEYLTKTAKVHGVDQVLRKPFSIGELRKAVFPDEAGRVMY